MKVKTKITYNAGKLLRALPKIFEKFNSDLSDRAKQLYIKNAKNGLDIYGEPFEELSEFTKNMRKRGLGKYKTPVSHDRPLIASGNMLNSIQKSKKSDRSLLFITGYGVKHNRKRTKFPQRPEGKWFGASENVINNIVDNKKIKTFRKQVSRAFKK